MQKQIATWKFISDSLSSGIAVMLLYVLESTGSSPGRGGFFMAVNANGQMKGSIGGGIMEHKFVDMAKAKLATQVSECSLHKQVHNKTSAKNQSGMICSGEQTILLYRVKTDELPLIDELIECLISNQNSYLQLSPAGINLLKDISQSEVGLTTTDEHDWRYIQMLGYKHQLFIIGAGHCALALSKIMCMLDFFVHLIDDRNDLNTFEENKHVHLKQIVESYSDLNEIIQDGGDNYVIIMTMGYRTDDLALRALKDKDLKYIGVLGSAKKIEKMFSEYRQQGLPEAWLSSISAPAGLPIKSQTPEEIAISIAAEIIKVKNHA